MFSSLADIAPCLSSVTEQDMNKDMTKIPVLWEIWIKQPELLESHPKHLGEILLMKQLNYMVMCAICLFKGPFIVTLFKLKK